MHIRPGKHRQTSFFIKKISFQKKKSEAASCLHEMGQRQDLTLSLENVGEGGGAAVVRRASAQVPPGQRLRGTVEKKYSLGHRAFLSVLGDHHPAFHLLGGQGSGVGRGWGGGRYRRFSLEECDDYAA